MILSPHHRIYVFCFAFISIYCQSKFNFRPVNAFNGFKTVLGIFFKCNFTQCRRSHPLWRLRLQKIFRFAAPPIKAQFTQQNKMWWIKFEDKYRLISLGKLRINHFFSLLPGAGAGAVPQHWYFIILTQKSLLENVLNALVAQFSRALTAVNPPFPSSLKEIKNQKRVHRKNDCSLSF